MNMKSKATFVFVTPDPPNNAQGLLWMAALYY